MSHVGSDVGVRGSKEQEETGVPGEKPPTEAWVGDHLPSHIRPFAESGIRTRDLRACHGFTFVIEPYNTSAPIGENGTLGCIITNKGSDSVVWKKQQSGGSYTSLTFDGNVASDKTKYDVGTYNLTIINVQSSDAGIYQVAVGSTTRDIYFQPVVLPTNVSVYWENSPASGRTVNITCRATYSNPPPYLRWYKGVNDLDYTSYAYYYTENVRSSGYGDAVSTMAMTLTGSDQNTEIRCEAWYDGYYNAMNYTLNIQLSGVPSLRSQGVLALVFLALSVCFKSFN
ncbi:hypothetical protein FSP39_016538 [Pinctada imbricata]|uniref:Ig-like domain-containing protein n=1 Tax=Pinctada imbricata TaxID=66713 RepID=A0AA88XSR4_PINIB|nr:hypothetical protein FSP39_016538 [Pinctada imbricata]